METTRSDVVSSDPLSHDTSPPSSRRGGYRQNAGRRPAKTPNIVKARQEMGQQEKQAKRGPKKSKKMAKREET